MYVRYRRMAINGHIHFQRHIEARDDNNDHIHKMRQQKKKRNSVFRVCFSRKIWPNGRSFNANTVENNNTTKQRVYFPANFVNFAKNKHNRNEIVLILRIKHKKINKEREYN